MINWGSQKHHPLVDADNAITVNHPNAIRNASNKLVCLQNLQGVVDIPVFTTNRVEAVSWLSQGIPVVCRTVLNGHSGEGIVIAESEEQVVDAPLYCQYFKKTNEYRVHVFNGDVIFVQQKKRRIETPDDQVNWKVRNHSNGFIYANQDIKVSEEIQRSCIQAVSSLGLHFGAVDVIEHPKNGFKILEINTAPGLTETTASKYCEAIKKFLEEIK